METKYLFSSLKNQLRKNRVTYLDVANALHLSEASVKRMFSHKNMSLSRFDQVLKLINMDFTDLVKVAEEQIPYISRLTESQERELVSDTQLLLVAIAIRNQLSIEEIVIRYDVELSHCRALLQKLQALGLIEIKQNDLVKLRISRQFQWIPNGPIEQFFRTNTLAEFFDSAFDKTEENLAVAHGMLSKKSNERIRELSDRLITEFYSLYEQDVKRPNSERVGTTLIAAVRPLELSVFKKMRRE